MSWLEWWEGELRRIFNAWYNRFPTPEDREKAKREFEAAHPWWRPKDSYGIRSHNVYRNNTRVKP